MFSWKKKCHRICCWLCQYKSINWYWQIKGSDKRWGLSQNHTTCHYADQFFAMACCGFTWDQEDTSKFMTGNLQGLVNNQTVFLPWEVPPDGWRLGEDSGNVPWQALFSLNSLSIPLLATFGDRTLDKPGSVLTQQTQSYTSLCSSACITTVNILCLLTKSFPNERDKLWILSYIVGHYSPSVLIGKEKYFEKFESADKNPPLFCYSNKE